MARASPRFRRRSGGSRRSGFRRSCGSASPRSISPVKAVATGPVISTWPSSRHSMVSSPPSSTTRGRRPVRPRRCALTSAAQAPEPQAQRQAGAAFPDAQPDAVRCQHLGEADIGALGEQRVDAPASGRVRRRARAATSGTKNVACGLPMLAAAGSASGPSARSRCSVSIGRASGMSCQSSRGRPHVHLSRWPSGSTSAGRLPATVRITWWGRPVSAASSWRRSAWRCRRRRPRRRRGCGCA